MFDTIIWGKVTLFDLIVSMIILLATALIAKGVSLYLKRIFKDKIQLDHLSILVKVVSYSIIGIGLIAVFALIGIDLKGLLFAGTFAGVVVGIASQNVVGNMMAGLFLVVERPLKIGDQVEIDDVRGFVEDIRILSTSIRTYDGMYVRIPNQTVFTTKMVNYVFNQVRRFSYNVGIRYSDDADRAISIIRSVLDAEPFVLHSPAAQVFVHKLGDNAVEIMVRPWAPVTEWYSLKMKLLWEIKKTLEENGIEIAFPQRTVWFGDGTNPSPNYPSSGKLQEGPGGEE